MYHGRFTGSHYAAGYRWGCILRKNGKKLGGCPTFALTEETRAFAAACAGVYQAHFPEILEEIQGIADGNEVPAATVQELLLCMYCFEFSNKCTCFALRTEDGVIFGRNSDFLVSLEKLYMNCLYSLDACHAFNGNTTSFVQMEDGVNEHGLAVGLTFIYPWMRKPGLNAGMLTRYLLEKCKTTAEAIAALRTLPIASAQTLTIADRSGDIAVVECNPESLEVIRPLPGEDFVAAANNFHSDKMRQYRNPDIDDWRSEDRYRTACDALRHKSGLYSPVFAQEVLSGKYGFICQYDRKKGADTVWSTVYDLGRRQIWRVEGNPSRKRFKEDSRLTFQ